MFLLVREVDECLYIFSFMLEVRGVHCIVLVCRIRIIEDGKLNVLPQKSKIKMVTKMPDKHLNYLW